MKLKRELTVVLPHFQNLGMLAEQQRVWASYPPELRARLHVVVVDDCSPDGSYPTESSITVQGLASFQLHRLLEKKRWNWPACRNLGARLATTQWLLLTDMDHVLPLETLRNLLSCKLQERCAYRFKRVTATKPWPYDAGSMPEYKPHNDTWLLTRDMFFSHGVGGYDERLSGCYGTSGEFRDRVLATADRHVILDLVMVRYPREVIADASTSPDVYTRKGDPLNDADLQQRKAERAQIAQWRPLHGLVPSEEVFSTLARECTP